MRGTSTEESGTLLSACMDSQREALPVFLFCFKLSLTHCRCYMNMFRDNHFWDPCLAKPRGEAGNHIHKGQLLNSRSVQLSRGARRREDRRSQRGRRSDARQKWLASSRERRSGAGRGCGKERMQWREDSAPGHRSASPTACSSSGRRVKGLALACRRVIRDSLNGSSAVGVAGGLERKNREVRSSWYSGSRGKRERE